MNSKKKPHVEPTVESFIGKAQYLKMGQQIFAVNEKGHYQMFLDLRGWGAIQNMFTRPDKTVDTEKASKFQDDLGEWVADAINQKLDKAPYKINEKDLSEEANIFSEGWGQNDDVKSFIAGFKSAIDVLNRIKQGELPKEIKI